jgi:cytochrome c2
MPTREFRPPEERTSPVLFFVVGILMVVVTVWTVWDEVFTRRPWKSFQQEFNRMERGEVAKLLAASQKKFGAQVAKIDVQIAQIESKVAKDAEIPKFRNKLEQLELVAFERAQELGFAKANFDQAYFELNEGIRNGKDISQESAHVARWRKEWNGFKKPTEKADAARDAVKAQIEAKYKPLNDLKKRRRSIAEEITKYKQRIEGIDKRFLEIKQIVLRAYERNNFGEPVMRTDRCQTCHLGAIRSGFEGKMWSETGGKKLPFATHPDRIFYLKKHDPNKIGCQSCHGGQGSALKTVALAHGEDHFWEDKLLPKSEMGSKCLGCHQSVFNLPKAPILSRGISLVRELGCYGCHNIPGTKDLKKRGPDLSRIQEKVNTGWLVSWIKHPKSYNPRTKMPFFSLSDQESKDIASYIWSAGRRRTAARKIGGMGDAATIAKGKKLFEEVGCLGCHVRDAKDDNPGPPLKGVNGRPLVYRNRDFAPALGNVGRKVQADWLVRWIRNPKSYWHDTTMPALRISEGNANAIAAYLFSLSDPAKRAAEVKLDDPAAFKRGQTLIRRRGCAGCHVIPGMEKASRIGPNLAVFSQKKEFELSFGNVVNVKANWDAWTFGKLKNPKIYQTDRETLLMPNFDLSDSEARAIRVFLRGMVEHGPPRSVHRELDARAKKIELGRRMIEKYNCTGCHVIENWGGDILRRYKDKNNGPPRLTGEGNKVQPSWFFGFLKDVVTLRPWLKVRMPSFQMPEKDVAALVDYFAALDGKLRPYVHFDKAGVKPESLAAGRILFAKADCLSCHGDWPPPPGKEAPTAPSLSYAKSRLRPEWIVKWIQNPQKITPGTKMPVFFEGAGATAQILSGKRTGKENGRWKYELASAEESELAEEKTATITIGGKSIAVTVSEVDEKKITISSPVDLGPRIGRARIVSHGEPVDENLLGGDGLRQIEALRNFIMSQENFKAVEAPKKPDSAGGQG